MFVITRLICVLNWSNWWKNLLVITVFLCTVKVELTTTCLQRPLFWSPIFNLCNIKLPLNNDHLSTTAKTFGLRDGGLCTQVWPHFQNERQENTFPNIMGGNSEGSYNIDTYSQNGLYNDEKEDVTWKTFSKCINLRCMHAFTKLTKMNSQILVFLHTIQISPTFKLL